MRILELLYYSVYWAFLLLLCFWPLAILIVYAVDHRMKNIPLKIKRIAVGVTFQAFWIWVLVSMFRKTLESAIFWLFFWL